MWLGVVLFCLTPEATSCDVLIETGEFYLTEQLCNSASEELSVLLVTRLDPSRLLYACMPLPAAGTPL